MNASVNAKRPVRTRSRAARGAARARGFTLIEILTVLVILAILAGITIGVSQYVSKNAMRGETVAILDIVMAALDNYYQAWQDYPPDPGTYGVQPNGTYLNAYTTTTTVTYFDDIGLDISDPAAAIKPIVQTTRTTVNASVERGKGLMKALTNTERGDLSSKVLRRLPARAFLQDDKDTSLQGKTYLADSYGHILDYRRFGGLARCPVLVSAGPNGAFDYTGNPPNIGDDLYSDGRTRR